LKGQYFYSHIGYDYFPTKAPSKQNLPGKPQKTAETYRLTLLRKVNRTRGTIKLINAAYLT